jgi:hypothetical protein
VHRYWILVAGELSEVVCQAFEGWTVEPVGGETAVIGDMDQAALQGVLDQIRRLGLDVIEVRRLRPTRGTELDDGSADAPWHAPPCV